MRPSKVETSEFAWVKRKILSKNNNTSRPSSSRKNSAKVSAVKATRARAGGLVLLALNQHAFFDNPRLFHFEPKVVAFARALADAAEDRVTAVLHGDVVDQLHQNNRLAH